MRCCHHNVVGAKPVWKFVSQCFVFLLAVALIQILVYYGRTLKDHSVFKSSKRIEHLGQRTSTLPGRQKRPSHGFKPSLELGERGELKWRQGNSWIQFVDLTDEPGPDGFELERRKCRLPLEQVETVMLVMSLPNQTYDRDLARNVSMRRPYVEAHNVCAVMVLGYDARSLQNVSSVARTPKGMLVAKELLREARRHGDIVMVDVPDGAGELQTLKVLSGFVWARTFTPNAKFIGRIDVRTFVNLERLSDHLKTPSSSEPGFFPNLRHRRVPDIFGTPAFADDFLDAENYTFRVGRRVNGSAAPSPPFAMGFAYFVTSRYADAVLAHADVDDLDVDSGEGAWDDVYVTGRAAAELGAVHEWTPYDYAGNYSFEIGCEGPRDWITNPNDMRAASGPIAVHCQDEFLVRFVLTKLTWIKISEELRIRGYESCFFAFDPENRMDQAVSPNTAWMF